MITQDELLEKLREAHVKAGHKVNTKITLMDDWFSGADGKWGVIAYTLWGELAPKLPKRIVGVEGSSGGLQLLAPSNLSFGGSHMTPPSMSKLLDKDDSPDLMKNAPDWARPSK